MFTILSLKMPLHLKCVAITVCTVVQNCCKGDEPCQWNTPNLDPRGSKTPDPIDIKFDRGDYVGDITQHANIGISFLRGCVCTYA